MIGWSEKGEVSGEGVSLVRRREERLKRGRDSLGV